MKKTYVISEAQYLRLIMEDDAHEPEVVEESIPVVKPDVVTEDKIDIEEPKSGDECEDLMESVKKTQGGFDLRKLIKEGDSIKGEYKSAYGQWYTNEWDLNGLPLISEGTYNKYILTIKLPEGL